MSLDWDGVFSGAVVLKTGVRRRFENFAISTIYVFVKLTDLKFVNAVTSCYRKNLNHTLIL